MGDDVSRLTLFAVIFFIVGLTGCGGLRYSEVSPDAANCHPRQIAVLPADTTTFPEAKGSVDRLFAEVLTDRRWFSNVAGGEQIASLMAKDEELRRIISEYLTKRAKINFSDPALSDRIGKLAGAEAFLIARVDSWNYTVADDKKVAKVGITVAMVQAGTGKIVWNASHSRISEYLIIKPDLADMAKGLIREMTDHMPH
jgi:hypothetical protein